MPKILHIVKEPQGVFQVRVSSGSGEGAGAGDHFECRDPKALESALRSQGCTDDHVQSVMHQIQNSDNAEVRF